MIKNALIMARCAVLHRLSRNLQARREGLGHGRDPAGTARRDLRQETAEFLEDDMVMDFCELMQIKADQGKIRVGEGALH
jgi:hypothetical protein